MTVLIELIGAVALLLWGLRMVRTGIMRAYGAEVKKIAARAEGRIFPALFAGIVVAVLLQSSTATAMIVASFAGQGVMSTATALITMLGADVGTAIAVLVASQKISIVSPILLAIGVFGFLATQDTRKRNVFRAASGVGMILLALTLIGGTAEGLAQHQGFAVVLQVFETQPSLLLLFGLVLSYLAHSSLAIVLLTIGFVASGLLGVQSGLVIVLGANLGGALLPLIANWGARQPARVATGANALARTLVVLLIYPIVQAFGPAMAGLLPATQFPAIFHLVLNLIVALFGLFASKPLLRLSETLLPAREDDEEAHGPRHLDPEALSDPPSALACAKREALNMATITQDIVRLTLPVLRENSQDKRKQIFEMEDEVDRLFDAIKLYLAKVLQEKLSESDGSRALDILAFTANMEHIGDIVAGSLMDIAGKNIAQKVQFSDQGMAEISTMHQAVCANFELAINTFVSEEVELARALHARKIEIREMEKESVGTHLGRIGKGLPESLETSSVHLDVLRDLKRLNSHLTATAYPVLKAAGEVPRTKWKKR